MKMSLHRPDRITRKKVHGVSLRRLTVMLSSCNAERREVTAMEEFAEDKWLSRQQLAERYGLPVKTPAEWASKGTGPRYANIGRHVRYRLSDVIDWETKRYIENKRDSA
jgi:predicted DNA-binding transcriptional regulator AlpA